MVNLEKQTYDFDANKVLESEFFVNNEDKDSDEEIEEEKNPHEFELSTN